jgi:hypothetical protein
MAGGTGSRAAWQSPADARGAGNGREGDADAETGAVAGLVGGSEVNGSVAPIRLITGRSQVQILPPHAFSPAVHTGRVYRASWIVRKKPDNLDIYLENLFIIAI